MHDHTGHAELFRRLFWWNLLLAIPVVVFSEMVQDWFGYRLDFPGANLVSPVLGTVVFVVGGRRSSPVGSPRSAAANRG